MLSTHWTIESFIVIDTLKDVIFFQESDTENTRLTSRAGVILKKFEETRKMIFSSFAHFLAFWRWRIHPISRFYLTEKKFADT